MLAGNPYMQSEEHFFEDFPFSAMVPRWQRDAASWDPFHEFEQMLAAADRQNKSKERKKVGDKLIGHVSDEKNFGYNFDLSGFDPKDIKVKTVGQKVVVEAETEENEHQEGCHSFCHRHYHRTLVLPKNVKPSDLKSTISKDGVLGITAPLLAIEEAPQERELAIEKEAEAIDDGSSESAMNQD